MLFNKIKPFNEINIKYICADLWQVVMGTYSVYAALLLCSFSLNILLRDQNKELLLISTNLT